jgi:hypothetical protein
MGEEARVYVVGVENGEGVLLAGSGADKPEQSGNKPSKNHGEEYPRMEKCRTMGIMYEENGIYPRNFFFRFRM